MLSCVSEKYKSSCISKQRKKLRICAWIITHKGYVFSSVKINYKIKKSVLVLHSLENYYIKKKENRIGNAIHCSNIRQKCLSFSQHPSNVFPRANSNVSRSRFDGVIRLRISSWPLVRDGNISMSKTATRYHRGCFWELGAHFSASKFIGGTRGSAGERIVGSLLLRIGLRLFRPAMELPSLRISMPGLLTQ